MPIRYHLTTPPRTAPPARVPANDAGLPAGTRRRTLSPAAFEQQVSAHFGLTL